MTQSITIIKGGVADTSQETESRARQPIPRYADAFKVEGTS